MIRILWPPYCGAEHPGAGGPVVCDREHHPRGTRHQNEETGFGWFGAMSSYPRTPLRGPEGA